MMRSLERCQDSPTGSSQRNDRMRQVANEKWISDETFAAIREKREAKCKDKNRYQELEAGVQRKLRVDKK